LSLDVLAHSLNGQLQLLARDYGFLIVLLLMLTLLVIWRRSVFTEGKLNWLIAAAAIWAAGWLAVLLPWSNSLQEYYLLPASLGLCALGGIGSELLWRVVNTRHTDTAARVTFFAALVCGVGAVGFVACGLVNFGSNGRLQITIDRQNMAMIDSLARSAPVGSTVLFNLREPNEYVFEAGLFLGLVEQRTDLRVGYLSTRTLGQLAGTTLVVMMRSDTPSVQTVRMAGGGPSQDIWNSSVLTLIGPAAARIYHGAEVISPVWVNTNQWLCWAASALHIKDNWQVSGKLCPDRASFQSETIEYGWDIYAIQPANTVPRGRAAMGVFEPGTATWHLRLGISEAAKERTVRFGQPGDIPLVGDWDGDGMDGIGVFNPRSGMWSLDNNIDGRSDLVLRWSAMRTGDIPLAGDWNGDGTTSIGFFRPSDVTWHLRNSNTDGSEEVPVFRFGLPTDLPLVADWDGDGKDNVAIYRSSVGQVIPRTTGDHKPFYVTQGDIPVPTSWRRTAPAALSTFAQGQWSVRYIDCRCVAPSPLAPAHVSFGQDGDVPIAGGWYER